MPSDDVAADFTTGHNTLSTTAEELVAARVGRMGVTIKNLDAAISIYYGPDDTVTSSNGFELKAGESKDVLVQCAIYVIAASGTPAVCFEDRWG